MPGHRRIRMTTFKSGPGLTFLGLLFIFACGSFAATDHLQPDKEEIISRIRRNSGSRAERSAEFTYDIITPVILAINWNDEVSSVELDGLGAKYSVTMTRNRELIRPKAELLRRQGTQNVTERLPFDSHKHFIGHVTKRDLSTGAELARGIAAFTQTKGLDGSLYIDGKEIKLTPFKAESSVHDLHIIYMAEEEKGDLTNDMIRIEAIDTSAFSSRKKRDLVIAEQTVELMVTVEHDVYEELGYGAVDYMLSCVNFAQAIFMDDSLLAHGIKIKFTVVKMVLLESDELLSLTGKRSYGDITDLFATFAFSFERQQTWRDGGEEDLKYYDVAVVVGGTSVFDNGNDVGLSSFQGCDVNNHYIAIKYYTNDHTARILARQLGHVVGMDNDEPTQECYEVGIMSDVNVLTFTSCNRYDAMAYLSSQEGACFSDVPDDTVIFEALETEDERLDYDCYLRYAANSGYYSDEVCPWRKTFQTGDCNIWCSVIDKELMIDSCVDEGEMPLFANAGCGHNRVCDQVQGCVCPEGEICNTDGDGKALEGIDHYRVVTTQTYEGAQPECVAYGGTLANIRNVDIQNHLANFLDGHPEHDNFYFALHQNESAGFILQANGEIPEYFNWVTGEPNEMGNGCVVLSREYGYKWIDYGCWEATGSVCEIGTKTPVTYWLPQPTRARSDAEANCRLYGGRLAKIADDGTKLKIEDYLSGVPAAQAATGIYFGLQKVEGVWKYEDGHELRLWNDWKSGQPDGSSSCSVLSPSDSYQWATENCDESQRLHLCEFDCIEGAAWCKNGVVTESDGSCSCECNPGWKGIFCMQPEPPPTVRYMVSDITTVFQNASYDCSALGGRLAKAATAAMFQSIGDFMIAKGQTEALIGLHKEGDWWLLEDGTQLGAYSMWSGNNPGSNECAKMSYGSDWMWLGADCDDDIAKFVCEFDCTTDTSWCVNGDVIMDPEEGCFCQCYYTWTGEFCSERRDILYWLNPVPVENFDDAVSKCASRYGRLAPVPNAAAQSAIGLLLDNLTLSDERVYFDMHKVNGTWINADGEQVFENWMFSVQDEHDCATLNKDKEYSWQPGVCTWGNGRLSVCEFDCTDHVWCQHGAVVDQVGTCSCVCDEFWNGTFCEVSTTTTQPPTTTPEPIDASALWIPKVQYSRPDAKANCEVYGGSLAKINTKSTQARAVSFINASKDIPVEDRFYFGLHWDNGVWRYEDGEAITGYDNWAAGEPAVEGWECAAIRTDKNFEWYAENCTKTIGRNHLCEFDCFDGSSWCHNGGVVNIDSARSMCTCECAAGWAGAFCLEPDPIPTVRYKLSRELASFTNARDACATSGGSLARVQSDKMFQNLVNYVLPTLETEVLIGLHKVNGVWMADDTNQQGGYNNWVYNVGYSPAGRECVYIGVDNDWFPVDCSISSRRYVCEYDCVPGSDWCKNGVITAHEQEGCHCECNTGWSGEYCEVFSDIMYWVNPLPVSGLSANGQCAAMGGRLALVPNFGTQQAIGAFISTQATSDNKLYFDLRMENSVWMNSVGQQEYFDWAFVADPSHDCATLRKDKAYGFQSVSCTTAGGRISVCEFDCSNGVQWCRNGVVVADPVNGYCSCDCSAGWKGPFCLQPDTPPTVRYRLSSQKENYSAAKSGCEALGGDLARMQSEGMFQNLLAFTGTTSETEILVGLRKNAGVWMADDVTQQGGYGAWNKYVANSDAGRECVYVSILNGVDEWYMVDCDSTSRKHVCEFDCTSGEWCINGQVVPDAEDGCMCVCSAGWTGEFCEVRTDVRYWVNPSPVSGTTAAEGCAIRGGRLAVSPNSGTNKMIAAYVSEHSTSFTKFFFDLAKVDGVWVNQDGEQEYFNWGYRVEDSDGCATLRSDADFKWDAVPCSWANRLGVCEFECVSNTSWCLHGTVKMLSIGCVCECTYAWTGDFCDAPISALALWMPEPLFAWNEAKENCQMYGGRLLNVNSENAQTRARVYLESVGADPASGDVFIGVHKVNKTWVYYETNKPIQYSAWADGEPASGKNCAALKTTKEYGWVTEDCAKNWGNAHACEFDCFEGAPWCKNGDVVMDDESGTCFCECHAGWQGTFCLEPVAAPTLRFRLSTDSENYATSKISCSEYGGRLARMLSPQMQKNAETYLGTTSETDVLFSLQKVNGVWRVDDNTQMGAYTDWQKNIGTSANIGRDCAYISLVSGEWNWYMVKCTSSGRKHLCEFDCDQSATWCKNGVMESDPTNGCKCTCDAGWTGEFCEVRSDITYWLNPMVVKGIYAQEECHAVGGRLAINNNPGTQRAIKDFLETQNPSNARIYFGVRRENLVWVNDDGQQVYFNWLWDAEINDTCASIRVDRHYKWHPRPCKNANSLSICEFECLTNTDWCVNGVVTTFTVGCECTCDAGWTGKFCNVAARKKRSLEDPVGNPAQTGNSGNAGSSSPGGTGGSSVDSGNNAEEEGQYYYGIYRSKEAHKYDYVYPECETYDSGIHKNCLMKAFGCEFYFNLTENIELIAPTAKIIHFKSDHIHTSEFIKPRSCHFMGPVTRRCGIAQVKVSHGCAAVSPCGTMGGTLFFKDMRYNILPVESNSREFRGTYMLVENPEEDNPLLIDIFRSEDLQEAGPPTRPHHPPLSTTHLSKQFTKPRLQRRQVLRKKKPEVDGRRTVHLEMMLTVNYDVYKEYGDESAMFALTLINNVQAIYRHESLYEYGIHVILHVMNVQILEEPILEDAYNVQRWADISDLYMAYKCNWEPTFWIENDEHPYHYDVAILLAGPSVVDTKDDTGLSNFQSCNTEPCSVVKLSSFEGARGTIAHEIGLMLGMYYDQLDPNCHDLLPPSNDADAEGIMLNADRVHFTECNRQDLLNYVNKPYITCFDDAPVPGNWQTIATYPSQADIICKTLYKNNPWYYSDRSCPWDKPEMTGRCELWCEYVEMSTGIKKCKAHYGAIPPNSKIECGSNKVCDGDRCVCEEGVSCLSKREEESAPPTKYKVIHTTHLNWQDAVGLCLEMNGEPASIANEATRLAVENVVRARPAHDKFFLGFRRNSSDSNEWLNVFEETISFFDWVEGEPNENDKECAVMSRQHDYKWVDHTCAGGASSVCAFNCSDDSWCIHGDITMIGGNATCTCTCQPEWKGEFCDEFVNPLVSRFYMPGRTMNRTKAKEYCEVRHGYLPSALEETRYNDFVVFLQTSEHASENFYLDLELVEHLWRDSHSKAPHITKWMAEEPRNGHVCVVASGANSYQWISSDCTEKKQVVCEFPCQKSKEKWCKQGDLVDNGHGVCECICWPGSFGQFCEQYNYKEVLHKSILFYEAQRSGFLPLTNRIPWRGDSALLDMGLNGEDLTGGWYDAGDHVKFMLAQTNNLWKLMWGLYEFKDAYVSTGELDNMYDCVRWGIDFVVKCHTKPNEFYAVIGDPHIDHGYWGRPEEMDPIRNVTLLDVDHPGSDIVGNAAAALAISYMVFIETDPIYANKLLSHARELYDFANLYQGKWSDSVYTDHYVSSSYYDELTNAAITLYRATGEQKYLTDAEKHYNEFGLDRTNVQFSWSTITSGMQVTMYLATGNATYLEPVESFFKHWFPGGGTYYTPKGLAWKNQFQPLKHTANTAFLATVLAKYGINTESYAAWARSQIHYILGDSGRSYVGGFGKNPPQQIHHRGSSCPSLPNVCNWDALHEDAPNPQILYGALVGGPDKKDNYDDKRANWVQNEAGIYGSGFQSAIAGLKYLKDHGLLSTY